MKINPRNPVHWWVLLLQLVYTWAAILVRPFRRKAQRPIVVLYGHQLSGNLKALYQQWEESYRQDYDAYYLALDKAHAEELRNQNIQVLRCYSLREMLILAQTGIMISDHGLHLMSPLVSWTDIKFVDVWHGIPFKGFTPDDFRLQHRYDEVWVSSPLLTQLYQDKFGFDPWQIKNLGYARTDTLFLRPLPKPRFREQHGISDEQKLVLYAPTWQQDHMGRELFPFGLKQNEFLAKLSAVCAQRNAILIVRSHQNSRMSESDYGNVVFCPQHRYPDTEDLLLASDLLICDWSSIAFDYLALERPTIFLDVPPPFKNGFSLGPEYRFGEVVNSASTLTERLSDFLLNPDDYLKSFRHKHQDTIEKVYGDNTDGNSARRQWERISQLL